jgi:hypothetical protein
MAEDKLADFVLQQDTALAAQRLPFLSLWQDLAEICHPRRNQIQRLDSSPNRDDLAKLFDSTAVRGNNLLANGQASRITPMGARWFVLRPPDAIAHLPAAQTWYQQCSEILSKKLYGSNFYNRAHEHYKDRGAFGLGAIQCTPGKHGKGLHFTSLPVGTYAIAQNAADEVDVLSRRHKRTPAQILETFGRIPATRRIQDLFDDPQTRYTQVEIVHSIHPRDPKTIDPRRIDNRNMPFASVHVLVEDSAVLSESGFPEFPTAVSRWEMWGDTPYGWAPAYTALSDATQANHQAQMQDVLAELQAFPRVLYTAGLKGDIDFKALGLTCWDPAQGEAGMPREWLTQGRYDVSKDSLQDKRRAIEEAFFVPLFNAISQLDRDVTATEVRAVVNESREMFHPIFSSLTREFLVPTLRRAFSLIMRQGEFPEPPRSVIQSDDSGPFIANPDVEFVSAMALALEQSHLGNFADVTTVLAPFTATDPGALDFIDIDRAGPALFRYKGLPADFIRSPEAIDAIRQGRAAAAQMQQAQQAAGAVKDLGGPEQVERMLAEVPAGVA